MRKISAFAITLCAVLGMSTSATAASVNTPAASGENSMFYALLLMFGIAGILVILSMLISWTGPFRRGAGRGMAALAVLVYIATVLALALTAVSFLVYNGDLPRGHGSAPDPTQITTAPTAESTESTELPTDTEPVPETEETTEPPTEDPRLSFTPVSNETVITEEYGISWEVIVDGQVVEDYTREEPISFPLDTEYFSLPGIATFRGNNYRDNAVYGSVTVNSGSLSAIWNHPIGSLDDHGGCCWTGQPLVVQWDAETKAIMNLHESKKNKEDLVEVIYATLDGFIHFYDLEDGTETRDPIYMGVNFKGAGALDPRGYPLLYVGSGYNTFGTRARMYIISLIDGSILYEAGYYDPDALRTDWSAFDSSPLVDAETDTLIWPGENGLLYTYKLNTVYDKEAGTISVSPSNIVKARYSSNYSRSGRYLGYEASASIVDNYLFISENSGLFYCVDLNTMDLIWAQDTLDDSNSSPVFEWGENGEAYIYTAPSLHWTAYASAGTVSIYKLDAATGEILWTYSKDCVRDANISGGAQSTPVLGREGTSIEGMVIYNIACTPSFYKGVVTALDTETGEVIWEVSSGNYAWSSPVPLYTEDGNAYIFMVNASGYAQLLDGSTGETLCNLKLTGTTEASPVVYNNYIVIGTREKVYCLKVS